MLNEFSKNRKGTFCLRSKKVLYGFILQEKVSKRVRDTNDREESGERGGMGVIAILLVVGSKFKFFFLFMH